MIMDGVNYNTPERIIEGIKNVDTLWDAEVFIKNMNKTELGREVLVGLTYIADEIMWQEDH